jgi:hypothetical protein
MSASQMTASQITTAKTGTEGNPKVEGTAAVKAEAEVKKSSHRYSPRLVEPTHPYHEKGFTHMIIDVDSNTAIKGFIAEEDCQKECERLNHQ